MRGFIKNNEYIIHSESLLILLQRQKQDMENECERGREHLISTLTAAYTHTPTGLSCHGHGVCVCVVLNHASQGRSPTNSQKNTLQLPISLSITIHSPTAWIQYSNCFLGFNGTLLTRQQSLLNCSSFLTKCMIIQMCKFFKLQNQQQV